VARAAGVPHVETLTGFKWITTAPGLRYGYEEAIGYCCDPDGVLDKDGITAALLVAEMAAGLATVGRSLLDVLDDLARRFGVHDTSQVSVRVTDLTRIAQVMAALRASPPRSLGGVPVLTVDDLLSAGGPLPPTDALRLELQGGDRVIVRPSGTEPKVKCYLEVVQPVVGDDLPAARKAAQGRMQALRAQMSTLLA
jgi:phosphomannomutase